MSRRQRGMLLFELVIVIGLGAVMLTAGVHYGRQWQQVMQARQWAMQMQAALGLLRRRALHEGRDWLLCASTDGQHCESVWRGDWLVFADLNQDGIRQAGEPTMSFQPMIPTGWHVVWKPFRAVPWMQWLAGGDAAFSNGTLTLCPPTPQDAALRQLVVSKSGRVRVVSPRQEGTLSSARAACGWP